MIAYFWLCFCPRVRLLKVFRRPLKITSLFECCSFLLCCSTVRNLSVCPSYCLVWWINVFIISAKRSAPGNSFNNVGDTAYAANMPNTSHSMTGARSHVVTTQACSCEPHTWTSTAGNDYQLSHCTSPHNKVAGTGEQRRHSLDLAIRRPSWLKATGMTTSDLPIYQHSLTAINTPSKYDKITAINHHAKRCRLHTGSLHSGQ